MKCEDCGRRDSLIHLSEITDGEVQSTWLCPSCAATRQMTFLPEEAPTDDSRVGDFGRADDAGSLAAFLNHDLALGMAPAETEENLVCGSCGYTLQQYRTANRLGCPRCYRAFGPVLRTHLARYHGRCLHLGRMPGNLTGGPNTLAELTRCRIDLERAIKSEDFENAALVRDRIRQLEAERDGEGTAS